MLKNWILQNKEIISLFGPFLGAFFAFCFFIIGERWRSKREGKKKWRKTFLNEHAHLERYLQYLIVILTSNIEFQKIIIEQYNNKQLALRDLWLFPIREDSSMKLDDLTFLGKIEYLITNLKKLNADIKTFNDIKNKMNNNIEKFVLEQRREDLKDMLEKSISIFLEESKIVINFQEMLKDEIIDLVSEDMFLYYFYKKKFIKKIIAKFRMKFDKNYRKIGIGKTKENILKQVKKNIKEVSEKYKKYGIIK